MILYSVMNWESIARGDVHGKDECCILNVDHELFVVRGNNLLGIVEDGGSDRVEYVNGMMIFKDAKWVVDCVIFVVWGRR